MTNDSKTLTQEEVEKRLKDAQDRFDQNLNDFKRKKLAEIPCFRSTFFTSKILFALYFQNARN